MFCFNTLHLISFSCIYLFTNHKIKIYKKLTILTFDNLVDVAVAKCHKQVKGVEANKNPKPFATMSRDEHAQLNDPQIWLQTVENISLE